MENSEPGAKSEGGKRTVSMVALVVFVLVGGFFLLNSYIYKEKQGEQVSAKDPKNAAYIIDGKVISLTNGRSEIETAPGSVSKIVTEYFGNEVVTDLDGDGREDTAFLLTQETGGSGTFFYVVAALNKEEGYIGSQALLLGDRIAPQTTEVSRNPSHVRVIVVNYTDRNPGEPMTISPSLGKSIWLKLDSDMMQFGEVVQDFSGEADVSKMTLSMKEWIWIETLMNNDTKIIPRASKVFSVTFGKDGSFSLKTDCNSVGGAYNVKGNSIEFDEMISTTMYCEGSQEGEFTKMLRDSDTFHFTSRGQLVLGLKFDSGSVIFR